MQNEIEKLSDNELFKLLSKKNRESEYAFLEIYRRYSGRIYAYCKRFLGNREDAMDAFQDTFVNFYKAADEPKDMTNLPAYLLRIARNVCLNFARQSRTTTQLEDYMYFENKSDQEEQDELLGLIHTALQQLPPDYREAFILREYEGMSYQEIAELLNISLALVKIRIFRAKEKLREILAPYISELSKM
ncbi:RNA polymerase sigma factor [Bacteroidetes/Chlorobi group bacterium MS-B_bin-24]|jgi:RNA polymerase sigma factor, sigma-70 family|nr:MAG: RNA polymerase sigma factor [Bacteroidetes/Chlorobi group bacterium MS-B_bin-24]